MRSRARSALLVAAVVALAGPGMVAALPADAASSPRDAQETCEGLPEDRF